MKRIITFIGHVACVTSLFYSGAGLAAAPSKLDLKAAIQYAVTNSPELDTATRQHMVATLEEENAFSKFLPSLDVEATHGLNKVSPSSAPTPWASQFTLGLTEVLYDNGESRTRYRMSKLLESQTAVRLKQARDAVSRDVGHAFLEYSLAVKVLELREEQAKLLKQQLRSVTSAYQQGIKTRKDFLRFKTQVSRSDIALVDAKNNLAKARQALLVLLAVPPAEEDAIQFLPENEDVALGSIPKDKPPLSRHYEQQVAALQKEVNDLEASLASRKYWPEVYFTLGAHHQEDHYLGTGERFGESDSTTWSALITVKYNLWDWGIRRRNVAIAHQKKQISDNALKERLLGTNQEIENLMRTLESLKESYAMSRELLKLEEDNMRLLETEYRQGKVQYLDFITGLEDLLEARLGYYGSAFKLKQGIYSYQYHQGTLYENLQRH